MKRFLMLAALTAAGAAVAQDMPMAAYEARAVLAAPATQAKPIIIDGRVWRCDGAACAGRAAAMPLSQPVTHECQRVARALGPVRSYRSRDERTERVLGPGCQRAA